MSTRILFVDDDPNVLRGLRRAMFEMSDEWEMAFASSGKDALRTLEKESFDVIVSDMRMPEMDGAELLQEVSRKHPHMVRIILSGQSDKESIMKSVQPTHQYLAKPCDIRQLNEIIAQSFTVLDLVENSQLRQVVSRLKSVPSLPTLYQEVMREMQRPDFKLGRIGEIISRDAGMTAKILQLVNSSFFGLPARINDPGHAAKMLGGDVLKGLILTAQVFSKFEHGLSSSLSIHQFSNHSLMVASLAKGIAKFENRRKTTVDDAFIAGLMHDIGKLVLAQNLPQEYDETIEYARRKEIEPVEAEREIIGSTHAEVGAYLIGLWGLPANIVKALAFHHQPLKACDTGFTPLTATYAANTLIGQEEPDLLYLEQVGLGDHVADWQGLQKTGTNIHGAL